jgi:DNA circularisation protein
VAWTQRLGSMLYRAPQSGGQFELLYDDLTRTGGRKAPVSEFPGQDQAAIQDLGKLTPRYPVTGYFTGADYDQVADRFWNALDETGPGTLTHPRWGVLKVIALTKEQREQFVAGAGRAVFTVEFIQADLAVGEYLRSRPAADDRIRSGADAAALAYAQAAEGADTSNPRTQAAITGSVTATVADSQATMQLLINQDVPLAIGDSPSTAQLLITQAEEHREEFGELVADITRNLDSLVLDPVTLVERMTSLFRLPAIGAVSVFSKITGYAAVFSTLRDTLVDTALRYGGFVASLSLANLRSLLLGASESTTVGRIPTRAQAQRSIDGLSTLRSEVIAAVEDIESSIAVPDYNLQALTDSVASRAIGNLVDRAQSLPTERIVVADRFVTPIVLSWELYGGIDRLDELIDYNGLTGDELVLIPPGREVRWYV